MLQNCPLCRPGFRFTVLAAAVQQRKRILVCYPTYVAGGIDEARIVTRSNRLAVVITGAQVLY